MVLNGAVVTYIMMTADVGLPDAVVIVHRVNFGALGVGDVLGVSNMGNNINTNINFIMMTMMMMLEM